MNKDQAGALRAEEREEILEEETTKMQSVETILGVIAGEVLQPRMCELVAANISNKA